MYEIFNFLIDLYKNSEISGLDFNKIFGNFNFIKINDKLTTFIHEKFIIDIDLSNFTHFRKVTVSNDAIVIFKNNYIICTKYTLGEEILIMSDEKYQLILLEHNYLANIKYVPENLLDQNFYLKIFSKINNKFFFSIIPDNYKTPEICTEAIKYNLDLIRDVPNDFITINLLVTYFNCLKKIDVNCNPYEILKVIPDLYKTSQFYTNFLEEEKIASINLILNPYDNIKINTNLSIFPYIPIYRRTQEIYELAIEINPDYINEIPYKNRTNNLYLKYVYNKGKLTGVEYQQRNEEICTTVINSPKSNVFVYETIPKYLKNESLQLALIERFGVKGILKYLNNSKETFDLNWVKLLLNTDVNVIEFIPNQFKTYKLYLYIVSKNSTMISQVPYQYRTLSICKIAMDSGLKLTKYFPKHLHNLLNIM